MYMFFWFFKQLFYSFKKLTKHTLLLLIVFFIAFLLLKNKCFATFDFTYDDVNYSLPDLPFTVSEHPDFIIIKNVNESYTFQVGYPNEAYDTPFYFYDIASPNGARYHKENTNNYGQWRYYNLQNNAWGSGRTTGLYTLVTKSDGQDRGSIVYSSRQNIYKVSDGSLYFASAPQVINPYLITTTLDIQTWNFDYLSINCGTVDPNSTFWLDCDYEGYTFDYNITPYVSISNGTAIIDIPKSLLNESIVLRNGFTFSFGLTARQPNLQVLSYNLGSFVLDLTTTQEEIINEDSDKQVMSDIKKEQQETNEKLDNIEETMTDTTLSDDSVFFPSIDIPDLTRDGLTHIFDAFVLAFCSDEPSDIVVPIPFTNKSFTIPYNYTYNMLSQYVGQVVMNFIQIFWWYTIGTIIALDVYDKMDKLQSGDIESVEKSNITTKML